MSMKNKKIILAVLLFLAIFIMTSLFFFPVRHFVGLMFLKNYPIAAAIVRDNKAIQTDLRNQAYKTAPTIKVIADKLLRTIPTYLIVVEAKAADGSSGKAKIIVSPPPKKSSRVTYKMSWQFDGRSNDMLGSYLEGEEAE